MKKKTIIALLVGVVAMLGILFFVSSLPDKEGAQVPGDTQESVPEIEVYTASYDSITKITLYFDGEAYTFSKDGAMWVSEDHPDETFNKSKLGSLATRLVSIKAIDVISGDAINPEDCGIDLDSPDITFSSNLGDVSIYHGNETANYEGCYFMTSLSSDVYVISLQTNNMLFESFDNYKNEKIHVVDYEKISAIEFKNENCAFSLRLEKADMKAGIPYAWRMISPIELLARDTEIEEKLINPVSSIDEKMYVSKGNLENYGLGDKNYYMVLTDSNGESQRVYFSSEIGGKCYMSIDDGDYVYESSSSFAKIRLIDIVSRYLYTNQQANMDSVTVSYGETVYTLDFSQSPAIIVNGNKITDSDACNQVFFAVGSLFADDISTENFGKTEMTMTYSLKNGQQVVVSFSEKDARYWNVAIDGKPTYTVLKSKINTALETLKKYSK